jgi:hypothetical protein
MIPREIAGVLVSCSVRFNSILAATGEEKLNWIWTELYGWIESVRGLKIIVSAKL